jgi:hypothetical protein
MMHYEQYDCEKEPLYTTEKYIYQIAPEDEIGSIRMRKRGIIVGAYYMFFAITHLPFMFLGVEIKFNNFWPIYTFFMAFNITICVTSVIVLSQAVFLLVTHMIPKVALHVTKQIRMIPLIITFVTLSIEAIIITIRFAGANLPGHAVVIGGILFFVFVLPSGILIPYFGQIKEKKP